MNGCDVGATVVTSQEITHTSPICHARNLFPRKGERGLFGICAKNVCCNRHASISVTQLAPEFFTWLCLLRYNTCTNSLSCLIFSNTNSFKCTPKTRWHFFCLKSFRRALFMALMPGLCFPLPLLCRCKCERATWTHWIALWHLRDNKCEAYSYNLSGLRDAIAFLYRRLCRVRFQ